MRKASSLPLGAARFRALLALADLRIYDDKIEDHRRERQLLEAERLARLEAERQALRAIEARKAAIHRRELEAIARMSTEQRDAWRWEVRVVGWLTDDPN